MKQKYSCWSVFVVGALVLATIVASMASFRLCANYKTNNLIVLIDWNYETVAANLKYASAGQVPVNGCGPATLSLITALSQKAAPILVTVSVWKNFVARRQIFADLIDARISSSHLMQKYNRYTRLATLQGSEHMQQNARQFALGNFVMGPGEYDEMHGFYTASSVNFDPSQWDIYKVGEVFYLCVPKDYRAGQTGSAMGSFTSREVALGIKLPDEKLFKGNVLDPSLHAVPVQVAASLDMGNKVFDQEAYASLSFSRACIQALSSVFITRKDFENMRSWASKNQAQEAFDQGIVPSWVVYLNGHGSEAARDDRTINFIAGLVIEDFKTFLQFLDKQVRTTFFFYSTCYSGGENLRSPYQTQGRIDNYSYVIAAVSLAHTVTLSSPPYIERMGKVKMLVFAKNFTNFFNEACAYFFSCTTSREQRQPSLSAAQIQASVTLESCINQVHDVREGSQKEIPAVRFAHTEWFSAQKVDKEVMRLTQTLARTRGAEGKEIRVEAKKVLILEYAWSEGAVNLELQKLYDQKEFSEREIKRLNGELEKEKMVLDDLESQQDAARHTISRYNALVNRRNNLVGLYNSKLAQLRSLIEQVPQEGGHIWKVIAQERTMSIPTKIRIEKSMPLCMVMLPQNAFIHIKEIMAPQLGLSQVLKGLIEFSDTDYGRTYMIDSLKMINDLQPAQSQILNAARGESVEFTDVVVLNNARNPFSSDGRLYKGILFKFQGQGFSALWDSRDSTSMKLLADKTIAPLVYGRIGQEQENRIKELWARVPHDLSLASVSKFATAHKKAAWEGQKAQEFEASIPEGNPSILEEWQPGRLKKRAKEKGWKWNESVPNRLPARKVRATGMRGALKVLTDRLNVLARMLTA